MFRISTYFSEKSEWNADAQTNCQMNRQLLENMDRENMMGKTKKRVHVIL